MTLASVVALMLSASPRAPLPRVQRLAPIMLAEAAALGVPVDLGVLVAAHESAYRQDVIGKHGELGVMQVKPDGRALRWCRTEQGHLGSITPNVRCGLKLLRRALVVCEGDQVKALTHYNGGRCTPSGYASRVLGALGS